MPSVIRARHHPGEGFTHWKRRYHGPTWVTRMEIRALLEGWLINRPEKRAEIVENIVRKATGEDGSPADQIAAFKALASMELAIAKLDQDKAAANQAKVIVVRRVDTGPTTPSPEPGEGAGDGGSI